MSEILSTEALGVRYGTARALDAVTMKVARGEVYALLGRNGAGKTSLMRCLLGLQKPTEGVARLFGQPVWTTRAEAMARVGVTPEEPDAPPEMTAAQLSRFCARLYPSWDAAGVDARLSRFGVPRNVRFGALSKGQKGLVQLALALGLRPELLLLDDPTLGFDAVARQAFFQELIGELAERGTTVLLATHDLAGVERFATRIGILKGCQLMVDEPLESLKARFRRLRYANEADEERAEYGNELQAFDALRVKVRGWGVEAVVSNFDEEAFERFAETPGVVDAEASAMPLEEIFLALAGEEKKS